MSESANHVLSVASCIGRQFQLDVLSQVVACPDDELEAALEEASKAGIIEGQSVIGATITYRFSHAFFRQTLYDEIMVPRRIRLHQQIARALEDVHRQRLDEHAAELAEHFAFSSDKVDLAKAVQCGEVAARRAAEVFAYGEATRLLDRSLVVQDLVDPNDASKRCDLLLALGEALLAAGENNRVITDIAPDAVKLADLLRDRSRAFRACHLALDCIWAHGAGSVAGQPEFLRWAERASEYADVESVERVHADLALAMAWTNQGRLREARAARLKSLELARQLGDPEALFRSARSLLTMISCAPENWDERVRLATEAPSWPRHGVSGHTLARVLWSSGHVQLAQGERA
jgi:hypothetical protein